MKKSIKYIGLALTLTLSMGMMAGCGKKSGTSFKNCDEMVDKFSSYCELGEYKGVEYDATVTEVTDDMVQSQIDSFLDNYKTTDYVKEGTAKDGDTVNIDYVGSVDGVEFAGGSTNGAGTDLTLGSGTYIDGFEEQIVGHKVGDNFDVNVTFPENYGSTDLAGKDAVFKVTLNSIAKITYPEYDDAFIASNTDYTNVADYEASVKDSLVESNATSDDTKNKSAILTNVIDNTTINEYPQQYMEQMIEDTVSTVETAASNYGYNLETYVTAVYGMSSEQDFRDYVAGEVQNILKEKIVVCAIAKAENIKVSKDEIQDYKQELVKRYGFSNVEEMEKQYAYTADDYMYGALAEKVADFLIENNTPVSDGSLATGTDAQ